MVTRVDSVQFKTADGKRFRTEDAANAHENAHRFAPLIDPFLASRPWKRGRDTFARNILVQFLLHREKLGSGKQAEPAAED